MTDIVFIRQFKVQTVIGVYEWGKKPYSKHWSLIWSWPQISARPQRTDDLQYTLDYSAVCDAIVELCKQPHELIETVAEKVAAMVLAEVRY